MAPKSDTAERTCLVTREAQPPEGLMRFVQDPSGRVVPDIRGKLPGRGVWVTARRDVVAEAVRRKLFGRGFKAEVTVDADLPDWADRLLLDQALKALSMARKAGQVVTGFGKVTAAAGKGGVKAVIHAREAADDGRRKVAQVLRRRARLEAGIDEETDDDLDDDGDETLDDDGTMEGAGRIAAERRDGAESLDPASMPKVLGRLFSTDELDLALGGTNVVHAALLAGGAGGSFLQHAAALARYRGVTPDTDWTAGS